jgi:hypothetical protein
LNRLQWGLRCGLVVCMVWPLLGVAADLPPALLACRSLTDATERLACFDREVAAPTNRSAPVAATPVAPPPDPKKQFGLPEVTVAKQEVAAGTRAADAAKIEAHITKLSQTPDGRVVVTLDNEQVWRQLLIEADLLMKPGDAVTISRGVLGSYWLQTASKRGCKVTRVL